MSLAFGFILHAFAGSFVLDFAARRGTDTPKACTLRAPLVSYISTCWNHHSNYSHKFDTLPSRYSWCYTVLGLTAMHDADWTDARQASC